MGIKHITLIKKPDAFQLGANDPNDPKVQKVLGQIGASASDLAKIPKTVQLVTAQLAFAHSDLAFQGNHLFLGNFYAMNIYDISNPAKPSLVTSMVCPGGQGDPSVYKNLLFLSSEANFGRLDCGDTGVRPSKPRPFAGPTKLERALTSAPCSTSSQVSTRLAVASRGSPRSRAGVCRHGPPSNALRAAMLLAASSGYRYQPRRP